MHRFENYAKQFNWALDNTSINSKWTMRFDADERLTEALQIELENLTTDHENDDVNGIVMEAWLYFMGKKIKYGCRNKRKLMLFKTGIARIEDKQMDEHTILEYGKTVSTKERFIHYDFKDITHWINKMNWYATREVQDYYSFLEGHPNEIQGNDSKITSTRNRKYGIYYKLPILHRSWILFVYYYVFKLGFLDGKEGFIYNYMYHRWYRTLVDVKILENYR